MPPVERKKRVTKKKESECGSDNEANDNNTLQVDVSDANSEPKLVNVTDTQVSKRSKVYNADLFKLLEMVNKNKDELLSAVTKLEKYNYDKFSDLEHEYETTERENNERKINLQKSFDDLQEALNKKHNDLQETLTKKHNEAIAKYNKELAEKKYNVEKENNERMYKLSKDYEDANYKLEHEYKKRMDEIKREKDADSYKFSLETLKGRNEVPIKMDDLKEKNTKLENITAKYEAELKNLEKRLTDEHKKQLANELEKKDLQNSSATAELTARNKQQIEQIAVLKETIETLKKEMKEARELTKSVAESSRQGSIVQNLGNSK